LGVAIAAALVAEGARVIIADIDLAAATRCAQGLGGQARAAGLDVTDESQWERVLDEVLAREGRLDLLVNCAGYYEPNIAFEDMPLAVWQRHFAINSDSVFLGCKHAMRRMRGRGGAIVNIGSTMSITANPLGSAYCASKAAVLMTTRTAARAAGVHGIRVNAVLPGAVDTAMLARNLRPGEDKAAYLERLRQYSALHTLATPQEIARAVLFLADPANATVTGAHLSVDGGNIPGG
jgi:NAD(P)-dependent dehydrogenase (short-subunit alcohol dehydrogenase family)